MNLKISVKEVNINIPKNISKVKKKKYWEFGANEWHKLVSPYVPFQTGTLDETVEIKGEEEYGEIEYKTPYAHYIYEGRLMVDPNTGSSYAKKDVKKVYTGKKLKLSRRRHPLASSHWDKAALRTQFPKLVSSMQRYADSGRLNLDG